MTVHTLDNWRTRAACRGPETALFFPPATSERREDRDARERRAKAICRECPVAVECLNYALDHHMARLADDHARARVIAEAVARRPGVVIDLPTVRTNIVVFHLAPGAPDAATVVVVLTHAPRRERSTRVGAVLGDHVLVEDEPAGREYDAAG